MEKCEGRPGQSLEVRLSNFFTAPNFLIIALILVATCIFYDLGVSFPENLVINIFEKAGKYRTDWVKGWWCDVTVFKDSNFPHYDSFDVLLASTYGVKMSFRLHIKLSHI